VDLFIHWGGGALAGLSKAFSFPKQAPAEPVAPSDRQSIVVRLVRGVRVSSSPCIKVPGLEKQKPLLLLRERGSNTSTPVFITPFPNLDSRGYLLTPLPAPAPSASYDDAPERNVYK
jgi:hypothetical protein